MPRLLVKDLVHQRDSLRCQLDKTLKERDTAERHLDEALKSIGDLLKINLRLEDELDAAKKPVSASDLYAITNIQHRPFIETYLL